MRKNHYHWWFVGILLLLLPSLALTELITNYQMTTQARTLTANADRQISQTQTDPETTKDLLAQALQAEKFTVGDTVIISTDQTVSINSVAFGEKFRYTSSGGFSTLTLCAKPGYRLVCAFITLQNGSDETIPAAKVLMATLQYGDDYTNKAQELLLYRNKHDAYAGGLKYIEPNTKWEVCLLFAVPEDAEKSDIPLSILFQFDQQSYECILRAGSEAEPVVFESF